MFSFIRQLYSTQIYGEEFITHVQLITIMGIYFKYCVPSFPKRFTEFSELYLIQISEEEFIISLQLMKIMGIYIKYCLPNCTK